MKNELKKYKFKIIHFDPKTKLVTHYYTLKTKPITEDRFNELVKEEVSKYKNVVADTIENGSVN